MTTQRFGRALAAQLVLGCAIVAVAAQDVPPPSRGIIGCGKAQAYARRMACEAARRAEAAEYAQQVRDGLREALEDTDVLHCDLQIEIRPGQSPNLIGTNTLTVRSQSPALTQFTFRLREQFGISAATVNGVPVTVTPLSTTTRVVTLDRTYGLGEVFTLSIGYSGVAVSRGFGSIEFTTHNTSDPIVYTLSEPYYAYTWWPAKDGVPGAPGDNGDKFTLDLALTAPDPLVAASNGVLVGVDVLSGARKRYRWSTSYPLSTYLVCFSATNYNTWSVNYNTLAGGTMPVLFYIYPEHDTPANRANWEQVVPMLTTLRALYGEYPFVDEKYGIYECQFGGGMEHQTFTAQGTFDPGVTVHELGHQWWGDLVTCKTWNDIWLNEGFATYTEALWAEFKPGSSGLPALKSAMAGKKYFGAGTVYVQNAELGSLNAIFDGNTTYNKAGWVVHMLRHVLGDAAFFDMLAAYRAAYAFSAATTADFQAVCEPFYGRSLQWFFDEWVYGERAPAYAYGWQSVQVAGRNYLLLYIDQTQNASYQRFKMPIDIVVNGATYKVFNDADPEHFVIPLPAPATSVQLDPDEWILASARTTTTYVPGPPTIVAISPVPGAALPLSAGTQQVTITFHTPVNTVAGDYTLVGQSGGPIPVTFTYTAATNTARLTAAGPLAADTYTLTVDDTVVAVNSGLALDGEVADPLSPAALPSGDGLAGGEAVVRFTITRPAGDANCDGAVNFDDIDPFVAALSGQAAYEAEYPGCVWLNSDCNGDGTVNFDDMDAFVALLGG